ncbi:hypothetical protein BDN72DRAFT_834951 [Pluteus cervinus]|uniref:Uncharacterized protein n=1 Tax=Pluteus cervinus TaxID=181527 RepID=A0ACD3B6J3_9AGAR|nr:hypothetical protein BDN72DRAFT_834951 [Pluteus cervinus]
MGQFWKLINLDKCETIELGKLGEQWLGGTGCNLFAKLAALRNPSDLARKRRVFSHHLFNLDAIGDWTGDRLVCIGDYTETYPEGLLTKEDLATLETRFGSKGALYHLAEEEEWPEAKVNGWCYDPDTFASKCILRNITQRVYVRLRELAAGNCGDLEQVLLSYTCWSSCTLCSMEEYDLSKGEWAGHRFDVGGLDEQAAIKEGWKDVTKEVVERVKLIWDSEHTWG